MSGEVYNKDSFQTQFRLQKYILQHASHKLATSTLKTGLSPQSCQSCHRSVSVDAGLPGRLRSEQQRQTEESQRSQRSPGQQSVSVVVRREERGNQVCPNISVLLSPRPDWPCWRWRQTVTGIVLWGLWGEEPAYKLE